MLRASFALGHVAGIEIRAHYTAVLAFALTGYFTAHSWFPDRIPGQDPSTYALMGVSAALLLFVSVLLHELSHSIVARARGQRPQGIMLFVFGGVWSISGPQAPMDEFLISIVGPLSSFALAGVFWLAGQGLVQSAAPLGEIVTYLALVNLVLGAFNLLPVPPLDGGRLLRSLVWQVTGRLALATLFAIRTGQVLAAVLIGIGVSAAFRGQMFNGLSLAVTGWFLATMIGRAQLQQSRHDELFGIRVADLMDVRPAYARPDLTVEAFVLEHALRGGRLELMVLNGGRLAGIVTISDVCDLPQERWSTTPVARVMNTAPISVLTPEARMSDVLDMVATAPFAQIPVVRDGWVVGMLGRADVTRFQWLRSKLRLQEAHWHADSTLSATESGGQQCG